MMDNKEGLCPWFSWLESWSVDGSVGIWGLGQFVSCLVVSPKSQQRTWQIPAQSLLGIVRGRKCLLGGADLHSSQRWGRGLISMLGMRKNCQKRTRSMMCKRTQQGSVLLCNGVKEANFSSQQNTKTYHCCVWASRYTKWVWIYSLGGGAIRNRGVI